MLYYSVYFTVFLYLGWFVCVIKLVRSDNKYFQGGARKIYIKEQAGIPDEKGRINTLSKDGSSYVLYLVESVYIPEKKCAIPKSVNIGSCPRRQEWCFPTRTISGTSKGRSCLKRRHQGAADASGMAPSWCFRKPRGSLRSCSCWGMPLVTSW